MATVEHKLSWRDVRRIREARDMSQQDLAVELKMSVSGIQKVEKGLNNPDYRPWSLTRQAIEQWIDSLVEAGKIRIVPEDASI